MKKIHRLLFDDKLLSAAQVIHFTTHNEEKNSIVNKPIHPVIIPIGFEFTDVEIKKKSASDGKLRLIFLGRINRKKGIDLLAKGLAGTEKNILPNVLIDIYGDDDDNCKEELEILMHELNLQSNIIFCGSLNPKDRDEKLRNYDALVLTSHQENFGLVVAEALAQALPVYISDKVNLCDFVLENKCGWVSSLQVNNISNTLSEIFRTPVHKKNEMGLNGHKAVRKYFSMKEVAGKYAEYYQKIISKTHL